MCAPFLHTAKTHTSPQDFVLLVSRYISWGKQLHAYACSSQIVTRLEEHVDQAVASIIAFNKGRIVEALTSAVKTRSSEVLTLTVHAPLSCFEVSKKKKGEQHHLLAL